MITAIQTVPNRRLWKWDKVDIAGGLYAIFSTPPADDSFIQAAQDTWNEIFLHWLPQSEFEYDDTRRDFSYHDFRDHG